MGRSGNSQHIFDQGLGAVDVSLNNYTDDRLDKLQDAIMDVTEYTRVTRYKTFLHLDYKEPRMGKRAYYRKTNAGWVYQGEIR